MAISTSSIGSTSERMRATWSLVTATKVTSATSMGNSLQTFLHLLASRSQAWLVMHSTHFLSLLGFARHGRCRQDLSDIATSSRVLRRGALKLQPCAGIQSSTGGDELVGGNPSERSVFFFLNFFIASMLHTRTSARQGKRCARLINGKKMCVCVVCVSWS